MHHRTQNFKTYIVCRRLKFEMTGFGNQYRLRHEYAIAFLMMEAINEVCEGAELDRDERGILLHSRSNEIVVKEFAYGVSVLGTRSVSLKRLQVPRVRPDIW